MRAMRKVWLSCLAIAAAGLSLPDTADAAGLTTLQVDLDHLNPDTFIDLIHASIPELSVMGGGPTSDFQTLFQVEKHFLREPVPSNPQKAAVWRSTRNTIEALLRERLGEMNRATLQRLALGDGKPGSGDFALFPVLVRQLIESEVAKVCADSKLVPHFPVEIVPLPSVAPNQFSPDLKRVLSPLAKMLTDVGAQKPRGLNQEHVAYNDLMLAILQGRADKPAAAELLRFQWDSWCGTGESESGDLQWSLVFLQLLRERKIAEAVGATLFFADQPEWRHQPQRPFDRWRLDFLKFCGVDAESLLLANDRLDYLAASGSEKACQAVIARTKDKWADPSQRVWQLKNLALFLIPGPPDQWNDADPRKRISPDLQAEAFWLLNGAVSEDTEFSQLTLFMQILRDLRRPETREILERMLKHPSTTYAAQAADVLRSFGDKIPPITPAQPVRFRIYLNDQPWANAEIGCRVLRPGQPAGWLQSSKTDTEGFCTIDRDRLLDPASRGPALQFVEFPSRSGGRMWDAQQYSDPWVDAEIATPHDFAKVSEVRLSAYAWPIEIAYASPPPPPTRAATYLRVTKIGQEAPGDWSYYLNYEDDRMPAPERLTLSTLGPGKYRLSIIAPGSAAYQSDSVEVKPGMTPLRVKLEKGCHVYATLRAPENGRGHNEIRLYRGNEDVTDIYQKSGGNGPRFLGVPKGKYQLRVLSTEDYMRRHHLTKWEPPEALWQPDLTKAVDCEGASVDFKVDDATPALLDLGLIENKPVEAMRSKVTSFIQTGEAPQK